MTDAKLVVIGEAPGNLEEDQIGPGIMDMVEGIERGSIHRKTGRGRGGVNERGMMIDVGIPQVYLDFLLRAHRELTPISSLSRPLRRQRKNLLNQTLHPRAYSPPRPTQSR